MPNFGRMRDSVRKKSGEEEFQEAFGSEDINTLNHCEDSKHQLNQSAFKELDDFLLNDQEENVVEAEQENPKTKILLNI